MLNLVLFVSVTAQSNNLDYGKLWLSYMDKVARPVLSNLAAGTLKEEMPVLLSSTIDNKKTG